MFTFVCLAAVLSCSNDSPEGSYPHAPNTPTPLNGSEFQSVAPTLSWNAEGGLHYNVYLGTTSDPPLVAHEISGQLYQPLLLKASTRYYWRVENVGIDAQVSGPLWHFTTHPGTAPVAPTLIAPADSLHVAPGNVTLTWSPEPGDSLTFNVYLGRRANPAQVAHDLTRTSYVASVLPDTVYYWRVETRNHYDLKTTSPTRLFIVDPTP